MLRIETAEASGILEDEEASLSNYEDYHDASKQIGRFIDEVYMQQRIHSSLGWLTPVEFGQQWWGTAVKSPLNNWLFCVQLFH